MSNPNKTVVDLPGFAPSPIFSHCIVSGHQVYLAGQVGVDSKGNYVEGTIKDRTKALLERVNEKLGHVGCDLGDIVSIQIFLSEYRKDFANMNEAYIEALKGYGPLPVRTCIGVADLPGKHDIEMTVIAAKRDAAKL